MLACLATISAQLKNEQHGVLMRFYDATGAEWLIESAVCIPLPSDNPRLYRLRRHAMSSFFAIGTLCRPSQLHRRRCRGPVRILKKKKKSSFLKLQRSNLYAKSSMNGTISTEIGRLTKLEKLYAPECGRITAHHLRGAACSSTPEKCTGPSQLKSEWRQHSLNCTDLGLNARGRTINAR